MNPNTVKEVVVLLEQPAALMSLNDRQHWAERARHTALWRQAAWAAGLRFGAGQGRGALAPSIVQIDIAVPDPGRRRDPHNYAPTEKAIVDGLVDAGLWPDDTPRWVLVHPCRFVPSDGRRPARHIIRITPQEVHP